MINKNKEANKKKGGNNKRTEIENNMTALTENRKK